ncbi:uncharacterized protein AMSG_04201 [Thecamonas trahens ATCC 50062]|uniref:Uncharacterized protein n=1 Tax=Thecamonas trahens ATCC 50062 TaxID=461836 RepID=A0A0L0D6F7_THETB|nr:hypothetical protein AMSG_04201 [Thecamonas trahens ATCC 50062]KNC47967.1 hypothetical protein AMSG_04201 [Thecamonas trahens ATCC 50062]|eukprot:XP_013758984.1 hypothetical protein AMSG_04201 [Thecamonas trahens ATCC 50062]
MFYRTPPVHTALVAPSAKIDGSDAVAALLIHLSNNMMVRLSLAGSMHALHLAKVRVDDSYAKKMRNTAVASVVRPQFIVIAYASQHLTVHTHRKPKAGPVSSFKKLTELKPVTVTLEAPVQALDVNASNSLILATFRQAQTLSVFGFQASGGLGLMARIQADSGSVFFDARFCKSKPNMIYTIEEPITVKIYEFQHGNLILQNQRALLVHHSITTVAYTPSGGRVVFGFVNGRLVQFDFETLSVKRVTVSNGSSPMRILFHPDDPYKLLLAMFADGAVYAFDAALNPLSFVYESGDVAASFACMQYSNFNSYLGHVEWLTSASLAKLSSTAAVSRTTLPVAGALPTSPLPPSMAPGSPAPAGAGFDPFASPSAAAPGFPLSPSPAPADAAPVTPAAPAATPPLVPPADEPVAAKSIEHLLLIGDRGPIVVARIVVPGSAGAVLDEHLAASEPNKAVALLAMLNGDDHSAYIAAQRVFDHVLGTPPPPVAEASSKEGKALHKALIALWKRFAKHTVYGPLMLGHLTRYFGWLLAAGRLSFAYAVADALDSRPLLRQLGEWAAAEDSAGNAELVATCRDRAASASQVVAASREALLPPSPSRRRGGTPMPSSPPRVRAINLFSPTAPSPDFGRHSSSVSIGGALSSDSELDIAPPSPPGHTGPGLVSDDLLQSPTSLAVHPPLAVSDSDDAGPSHPVSNTESGGHSSDYDSDSLSDSDSGASSDRLGLAPPPGDDAADQASFGPEDYNIFSSGTGFLSATMDDNEVSSGIGGGVSPTDWPSLTQTQARTVGAKLEATGAIHDAFELYQMHGLYDDADRVFERIDRLAEAQAGS